MPDNSIRIVLAGSVSFSRRTLHGLVRHGANVVGVLGLDKAASANVSDFADLEEDALFCKLPYKAFTRINSQDVVDSVRRWEPDILFVVGLSQLVGDELMQIPRMGAVGFHPTRLPEGRGRAPVAWLTFDGRPGAATFFVLEEEADAGPIFVQEPFQVPKGAYAGETIQEVRDAIDRALDRWLPSLLSGEWSPTPQDHPSASFWGKRAAEDGLIDWGKSAAEIARLVRTASRPYPGAYTYHRGSKVIIWKASESNLSFRGVTGRVLRVTRDRQVLVQTGDGLLNIEEYESDGTGAMTISTGQTLGYRLEDELHRLDKRVKELERLLSPIDEADSSS